MDGIISSPIKVTDSTFPFIAWLFIIIIFFFEEEGGKKKKDAWFMAYVVRLKTLLNFLGKGKESVYFSNSSFQ